MGKIEVQIQYPNNDEYSYESRLFKLNLDEEREKSIMAGRGFLISGVQSSLKKDLKNPNSIYSTRFGQTLQDIRPFEDRYRCTCGMMRSRLYHGLTCPECGTKVLYVDDDFGYFGWIVLDDLYTIHPNLYKLLKSYIGDTKSRFDNILKFVDQKDCDGFSIPRSQMNLPKDEPYFGLGIMGLKENLDEVLKYYYKSTKKDKYDELMKNKDKIFTQSIPVK